MKLDRNAIFDLIRHYEVRAGRAFRWSRLACVGRVSNYTASVWKQKIERGLDMTPAQARPLALALGRLTCRKISVGDISESPPKRNGRKAK
jgi:hypothetical protein